MAGFSFSERILKGCVIVLTMAHFVFPTFPAYAVAQGFGIPVMEPRGEVFRHEPIFGIGPRTIWKNGFGLEVGIDRDKSQRKESLGLKYRAIYGLTSDWAVTAESRQVLDQSGSDDTGLGDLVVRTKYRIYRNDVPGGVFHAAVMSGVEFPTGASGISTESTDFFAGLSAAYEGRRWLLFATGRYRVNTEGSNKIKRGNVILYDVALGLRPVKTDYYQPDLVLMAELNAQIFGEREFKGAPVGGSSGERLLAGFGAWVTFRNWALKPGIQIPVYNNLNDGDLDYRFVVAIEFHI
ncbi:MAG: hypothetical protein BMS9Abin05_2645 [Rhodothermia bacterium]|nr:MAG: hypothetical protein BMS9Abin05_2645 [Rhodothermia bacterium]